MSIQTIYIQKLLLITALMCSSSALMAQSFYKWVDQHGSTHYTTTPPPKNAKKLSKVDTYHHPQSKATKPAQPSNQNPNTPPQTAPNQMDQQQQEANAALEQGRTRL
ncbi:DUF4124 domain-containing protein [uncultured Acinetobacter sp.]|uniref:DUF4124 domain-containing protein n=1 Tax=uncultured Acinetobacter sp. TaxID=165433 RepID=UPI0026222808|nr:DUF4124 domain-containing protein [uncultured Acinetobacter sp.]